MANEFHLKILHQGVSVWNDWRATSPHVRPNLARADLSRLDLSGVHFSAVDLCGANLGGAQLAAANLVEADLIGAILSRALLDGANLAQANLSSAMLKGAGLGKARFRHANLAGASLNGALGPGADFGGAKLGGADLAEADFTGANFCAAQLCRALLGQTNCSAVDFGRADLTEANLTEANLTEANLTGARFTAASVIGAAFARAIFRGTALADLDLSGARDLGLARHTGPSFLDLATLQRSRGHIPRAFLQGAGTPDELASAPGPSGSEPDLRTSLLCYDESDGDFVERLRARMLEDGHRVWHAPATWPGITKPRDGIEASWRPFDRFILVLSPEMMKRTSLIAEAFASALREESSEGPRVFYAIAVFPLRSRAAHWKCYDETVGRDIGRDIRGNPIPEFLDWTDAEAFESAYRELCAEFKTVRRAASSRGWKAKPVKPTGGLSGLPLFVSSRSGAPSVFS